MNIKTLLSSTAIAAAAFAAASGADAAPLANLFEIRTHPAHLAAFRRAGDDNLGASLRQEDGTLAMLAAHFAGEPNRHLVFEIYRDEATYRAHIASPHYRRFAETAKTAVAGSEKTAVRPEFWAKTPPLPIWAAAVR